MKNILVSLLIVTFCLCFSIKIYPIEDQANTRFTSFFIGGSASDFHPAFITLSEDNEFKREVTEWVQAALSSIPHLNFIPLNQNLTGIGNVTTKVEPSTLFIRGLVTRADIKKVEHFSTDEYVFSTNVTLEFFDLVSGEVFYTRTLTGQVFKEKPKGKELLSEEISKLFRACLKGTVEAIVRQIGEDYQPGVLEGHIVAVLDASNIVLDLGRANGIYKGMTFYFYNDPGKPPVGMIKTETLQAKICKASVIISEGSSPKRGWIVKSFGVNQLNQQKGQTRYMVAGFSLADSAHLPPDFKKIDILSFGQWLHDGLSGKTDLFMLAPLLAKLDSTGAVRAQEAFWEAQMNSIYGGLAESAVLGKRALPDVMVKGVISYAEVQSFITPGADNKILKVGISIEFYDRKTRDFLYSYQHSGRKVEKIVKEGDKVYRDLNLEASFRDLCKDVIREASAKIGKEYRPSPFHGRITSVSSDSIFTVILQQKNASIGDLFVMMQKIQRIMSLTGEDLGPLWKTYGIARLVDRIGENEFIAKLVASDVTQVQKDDILRAEGKHRDTVGGKLCQVVGWHVEDTISNEYNYSTPLLTEWLHDALLPTGKFRLLPPNFGEADMTTAEAGLTSGEFVPRDQGEIIYQSAREPEILISGRLLFAEANRKVGQFKDVLKLRSVVEITFTNTNGDTLFRKQLAVRRKVEQLKSKCKIVIGSIDISSEFDSMTRNIINELVKRIVKEYSL